MSNRLHDGIHGKAQHGAADWRAARTVDFKNTVIIMTSNLGSRHLLEGVHGDSIPDGVRESVMAELRRAFRPEFLNRIDETILFKPLTLEEITSIVNLLMADLNNRSTRLPGAAFSSSGNSPATR